jgi:hypothetical protein
MRRDMKHYEVVIEITGHSKKFDCYEEAHEYAENLARETEFEVVVVEIDPRASSWLDRYVPITLYDGATGEVKSLRD